MRLGGRDQLRHGAARRCRWTRRRGRGRVVEDGVAEGRDRAARGREGHVVELERVGAGFQDLAKNKKSSWGINYNYVDLVVYFNIVKQIPDYFRMPEFHNADGNFRFKTEKFLFQTGKFLFETCLLIIECSYYWQFLQIL